MAEQIREILVQGQDHQIDLATALGEEVPEVGADPQRRPCASAAKSCSRRLNRLTDSADTSKVHQQSR